MDEDIRTQQALFRFSLIAPIVNGSLETSMKEYLETVCAKKYDVPGIGQREFSPHTLRTWFWSYRKYGLDGLKTKRRKDKGHSRRISPEAALFITDCLKASASRAATAIHQDLLRAGIQIPPPSRTTVSRFVKTLDLSAFREPEVERKRYELPFANDCWQSDICVGPYLTIDGRKKRTFLIAFLDDASRLCVHAAFSFEENYLTLEAAFKKAILKRGVPKKLFTDNAKVYRSLQMRIICAKLGTILSFARPFSPASKGKIERWFRTFREQFLEGFNPAGIDLDKLNLLLEEFVEARYHQRPHSSLGGLTPLERYLNDKSRLRFVGEEELNRIFLHEITRRVTRDAVISINNRAFEVPQSYAGRQVKVFYRPDDLSRAHIEPSEGESWITVYPLRTVDNSQIPRKQNRKDPIQYSRLYEEDR